MPTERPQPTAVAAGSSADLPAFSSSDLRTVVVGAGGHAKVVMDALDAPPIHHALFYFADDNLALCGTSQLGYRIDGPVFDVVQPTDRYHVAIGNNRVRQAFHQQLHALGARALSVVHARAHVSPHSVIGAGVFVAAGAVVAALARLGDAAIVNHGAVVDHDCVVGRFAHVAPNATLSGGVTVGERVLIGAGAVVLPGLTIGDGAVVGAGAVVVRTVAAGEIVQGVPARARPHRS